MEWLKRVIRRLLRRKEPKSKELSSGAPPEESYLHRVGVEPRPRDGVPYRMGIRSTDLGMRKLRRHRSGRLHDRRSGFDPDKRMVDIEDDQTRKSGRKKKTWFVDRKK